MKKLFFILITILFFSCEGPPESDQYYDGVVKIWFDEDGRRHRTFKSDRVYSHIIDGKLIEYINIPESDTLNVDIDSLIEAD